jgi:hypothetical protein
MMIKLLKMIGLANVFLHALNYLRDELGWFREATAYGDDVWVVHLDDGQFDLTHILGVFMTLESAQRAIEAAVGRTVDWDNDVSAVLVDGLWLGFSKRMVENSGFAEDMIAIELARILEMDERRARDPFSRFFGGDEL